MDIRLPYQSYPHESQPLSSQRLVNCFAEVQPKSAKSNSAVFGDHGTSTFSTIGNGPIRGGMEMNGVTYWVSGDSFYSVDSAGTGTLLGNGITGNENVSMDGNGFEIVIVNGTYGFSYLLVDQTFLQIDDVDFSAASTVSVINEVFAFDKIDTNQFFVSDVLDGRSYDPLNFASAESNPDFVKAVRNRNGVLLVFGGKTIELWDNTGAADFAFSRIKGSTVDRGIIAPKAIEAEDSALFFLGDDLIFYRLAGLQLQRLSTHAIEGIWKNYTRADDAFCFKASTQGHKFIYVTFPTQSATWAFDIATGLWHERISWSPSGNDVRWRANCAVQAFGKTLIGDAYSGKIGHLDSNTYTEFGDPIVSKLVFPPVHGNGKRVFIPNLEIDGETGVGLATGQGSDPQWMLDYSIDGGRNYSAPQQMTSLGKIGETLTRMNWSRLGSGYQFTFRLSISDPVRRAVYAARAPDSYVGT